MNRQPNTVKHHTTYDIQSEDGFSAIIVTLIIIALVTLISIGFVRIVSQEQRASLDRQLSTQAFYAAETGVNDAADLLANNPAMQTTPKTECDLSGSGWSPNLGNEIEYTCVLIDPTPSSLEFNSISTNSVRDIRINAVDANTGNLTETDIVISWQAEDFPDSGSRTAPPSGANFPDTFGNIAPVLRVSLTPYDNLSRQALIENTMTFFLRPDAASPTTSTPFNNTVANQGQIIRVACDPDDTSNPRICNHQITGLSAVPHLMTVRALYFNASLRLDTEPSDVLLTGEQAVVDSTGRASDVLQRIQVRLPLRERFDLPPYSIEANQICKPYAVRPGDGDATYSNRCDY